MSAPTSTEPSVRPSPPAPASCRSKQLRPDLVRAIRLLIDAVPARPADTADIEPGDSLSPAAPFHIVNIGNSEKVRLLDFTDAIEAELWMKAKRNYMPMQLGDVPATWADANLLKHLTGYRPETNYR